MPGLLRGIARTAVIAGTATHVSNNVSRRQARKWGAQDQQAEQEQADQQQAQEAPVDDTTAPQPMPHAVSCSTAAPCSVTHRKPQSPH